MLRLNCKNQLIKKAVFSIFIVGFLTSAHAQLEIKKHTINNGNTTSSGGQFELKSSIGQVDVSKPTSGGDYRLNGGFWQQNNDLIFKNKFQ